MVQGSIQQYFRPSLSYHLSLRSLFCLFLDGHLTQVLLYCLFNFVYWKSLHRYLANSEDPDEMQHNAAFHQGLHCLLRLKQPSGAEIHRNLENSTCDPLKYTVGSSIFNVSRCMGKSIRIQRVNNNVYGR